MTVFSALLLLLLVAVAMWRRRLARAVAACTVVCLFLWTWDPATAFFARTLESQFTAGRPAGEADAIVVLGGNIYPPDESQTEILPGYSTYLRCRHAALLYRTWKALPVVATGGFVISRNASVDGTVAMQHVLESEGVPAAMIWVENQSRNTSENALHTNRLLRGKGVRRVALVTEAFHMQRARLAFERQGLEVVPAPCGFRSHRFEGTWRHYLFPRPQNMLVNQETLHEWIGWIWYRIKGV